MNVVHLNTVGYGGAFNAAYRLHEALVEQGVESAVLTHGHTPVGQPDTTVFKPGPAYTWQEKMANRFRKPLGPKEKRDALRPFVPESYGYFSFLEGVRQLSGHEAISGADIVHLHWVPDFLDWHSFFAKVNKPIVWTLHDQSAFTGGCHYSAACSGYTSNCFPCPIPLPGHWRKLPKKQLLAKSRTLLGSRPNLHLVCLSSWMQEMAKSSTVLGNFPSHLIPNSKKYAALAHRPLFLRDRFDLPPKARVLMFCAANIQDPRKGLDLLLEAFGALSEKHQDVHLLVVGGGGGDAPSVSGHERIHCLGALEGEEAMADAYRVSDALVLPSREDNLPNTALEAFGFGLPVIGFEVGGIPDMVISGSNGFLAGAPSAEGLQAALENWLKLPLAWSRETIYERAKERYEPKRQAEATIALYKSLVD